eukprot:Pgem_evm1s611
MAIVKFLKGPVLEVNQKILRLEVQAPYKAALVIDIPSILNLHQTRLNNLSVVKMKTQISTMPIVKAMVTCKYDARYYTLRYGLAQLGIGPGPFFSNSTPNIGDETKMKVEGVQFSLTGGITAITDSLTLDVSVKDGNIIISKASVDQFAINIPEFHFTYDDKATEIYNSFRLLEIEMYQKYKGQLHDMLASMLKDMVNSALNGQDDSIITFIYRKA